ncbi:hypothetical protein JHK87_008481 [Glycine soja]|nr:hypothetical protein JHK87_008481 [Glycine soja]
MEKRVISINCFSLEGHLQIRINWIRDISTSSKSIACCWKDPRELPWKKTVVPVESISTKTPTDAQEKKYKELAELGGILEENRDLSSLQGLNL